jgi:hypothetical protein
MKSIEFTLSNLSISFEIPFEEYDYYDEAQIYLDYENTKYNLMNYNFYSALIDFEGSIMGTINNELVLSDDLYSSSLGEHYGKLTDVSVNEDNSQLVSWNSVEHIQSFGMWLKEMYTWMYNYKNKIYIEICNVYPYHYSEQNSISFADWFMSDYWFMRIEVDQVELEQQLSKIELLKGGFPKSK